MDAASSLSATWSFPALIHDPALGPVFPTYMAHLLGKTINHPLPSRLACVQLNNGGPATRVSLSISLPVYSQASTQDVDVGAQSERKVCLEPTFDFSKLYALRDATPGRLEVEARQGADVIGREMKILTIAPVNDIAWTAPGISFHEMRKLSAIFVTPKAPEVDQLQRLATEESAFEGFGGADPYQRQPHLRKAQEIGVDEHIAETVVLEEDESLTWTLTSVSGGVDDDIDVYLFTPEQYAAWAAGSSNEATLVWPDQISGAGAEVDASSGIYRLVLANDGGLVSRTVDWYRNATKQDVVEDALSSIYTALRNANTRYSNIPGTFFAGWQHVRRAAEVVAALSANCFDGTMLFASTLELIGLEPVLIFVSGHVFVGVRSSPGSPVIWPVETTGVGTMEFSDAFQLGLDQLVSHSADDPNFGVLDIKEMRAAGVLPLPQ